MRESGRHIILLILRSRAGPPGLVALEARGGGTPVIATSAGRIRELSLNSGAGAVFHLDVLEVLDHLVVTAVTSSWKSTKGPATRRHVAVNLSPSDLIRKNKERPQGGSGCGG